MKRFFPTVLIVLLALSLLTSCNSPAEQPLTAAEMLDLGEKYLLDMDYEQALAQFLGVIEIDPKNPRGYTGAAESYIGLGRPDDAIAILNRGLAMLPGDESIMQLLADLTHAEPEPTHSEHEHVWQGATCQAPKTCIECGETEGMSLSHRWIDADYQNPQTCADCGEIEGEPIISDFELLGYSVNTVLNEYYPYETMDCDGIYDFRGEAAFSNFRIFESDEGFEAKEGYEYRAVTLHVWLVKNAPTDDVGMTIWIADYYDNFVRPPLNYTQYEMWTDSYEGQFPQSDVSGLIINSGPVYYNGSYHTIYQNDPYEYPFELDRGILYYTAEIVALVPTGYDGTVVILSGYDPYLEYFSFDEMSADSLIFRFAN